jgi:hypothetical protein
VTVDGVDGVMLWVLGGSCSILVVGCGYLLAREFTRKDKIEDAQNALAQEVRDAASEWKTAASTVKLLVEEVRSWALTEFVRADDHRETVTQIKSDLKACSERCPYRNRSDK